MPPLEEKTDQTGHLMGKACSQPTVTTFVDAGLHEAQGGLEHQHSLQPLAAWLVPIFRLHGYSLFFSENVQLKPWLFGRDAWPGACRDPILLQVVVSQLRQTRTEVCRAREGQTQPRFNPAMASSLLCAQKADRNRFQTWPSAGRHWVPPEAPAASRVGQALVLESQQMLSQATLVQVFTALQAGQQPASPATYQENGDSTWEANTQ